MASHSFHINFSGTAANTVDKCATLVMATSGTDNSVTIPTPNKGVTPALTAAGTKLGTWYDLIVAGTPAYINRKRRRYKC